MPELTIEADPAEVGLDAEPSLHSGGGGLVSTVADYDRFTQLLLLLHRPASPAGELDGVRLLSPRTVRYMTRNHLPGGPDLETFGRPPFAEAPFRGVGFGLGFAVLLDPVPGKVTGSPGLTVSFSPSCSRPAPTRSARGCASSCIRP